jgi:peptide/nickel transport system substrate-binding protein
MSINRRQFIGASAVTSAALLAGTGLDALGLGRAVVAQDGTKEFHGGTSFPAPPDGHFNSFVTSAIMPPPHFYGDLIWHPFAMYYWGTKEWLPLMGTDWAFIKTGDGASAETGTPVATPVSDSVSVSGLASIEPGADTFQVTLRQGARWSDGNEFTARDVLSTFWILRLMSNTVWRYLDRVEAVDDYTVNFVMSQPATVVQRYVLRTSPQSAAIYGEWADKAEALFTAGKTIEDPEVTQLLDQFTQFRPEQTIASGPYNFDMNSITPSEVTLAKNDQAFNATDVTFDRIKIYRGETDSIAPVVLSKEIDYATHGFPPAVEQSMIDSGIRVIRPPIYSGPALYINYGRHPQMSDKRVRQALAMAIDRSQNGFVSLADSGIAVQYMTGMSDNFVPTWMLEESIDTLNQYPFDRDAAAALLEEAGWTKTDDLWYMPDGTPAKFELIFPAEYADWSASGLDVTEQLNDFGIEVAPIAVTFTQQPIDVDKGNFDLAIQAWGSSSNPHPHYSYTTAFFTRNTLAINNGGKGIQFPLQQDTDVAGHVDLDQLTVDSADGLDEGQQRADVTTIAQVFNELLPIIPLFERYGNNAVLEGVRVQPWPDDSDPIYQNSPYADGINTILMLTGRLNPV